jgi:NAD(P)-dependent dehydrogenase (short-subunit alcohol dehydrogenase family)
VVVGASRGIGAAVARAFAGAGADVAVAARDVAGLERLTAELTDAGTRAIAVPTDVTDPSAVSRLIERVVSTFGRLDVACNNAAGGGHRPTPLADVAVDAFDSAYMVNLRGVFVALKYEIPAMVDGGGGAIVNMSSTAGTQAVSGSRPTARTKHGLEGLTKVAGLDYAAGGVRVNAIAPGPILTDDLRRAGAPARQLAAQAMPTPGPSTPPSPATSSALDPSGSSCPSLRGSAATRADLRHDAFDLDELDARIHAVTARHFGLSPTPRRGRRRGCAPAYWCRSTPATT